MYDALEDADMGLLLFTWFLSGMVRFFLLVPLRVCAYVCVCVCVWVYVIYESLDDADMGLLLFTWFLSGMVRFFDWFLCVCVCVFVWVCVFVCATMILFG